MLELEPQRKIMISLVRSDGHSFEVKRTGVVMENNQSFLMIKAVAL